uniref:THAP domain-containing protein 1 n=1 Tax=Neogobius melanostomus TaxID=47308 RepID=A0A8C6WZ41_9GOBI
MTITCVVHGCDNKEKKYSVVMFHRFQTHHKRRKVWLAALNMDPTTPVEVLKKWRICSEHFTEEDYTSSGLRLKDTAIPTRSYLVGKYSYIGALGRWHAFLIIVGLQCHR